jgi:hypothetical protein
MSKTPQVISSEKGFNVRQLTAVLLSLVACSLAALILFRVFPERAVGPILLFLLIAAFIAAMAVISRRSSA